MQIKEAMTKNPDYLPPETSLTDAAKKMLDLDCGFLPVGDGQDKKLTGVITDRDITIRAVAKGEDPNTTQVGSLVSEPVLYCYEEDELESAAESMRKQGVYRLVVLDNKDSKQLAGVISLGDIFRHNKTGLASSAAEEINRQPN